MNHLLTAEEALNLLGQGQPVEDVTVTGEVQLRQLSVDENGAVKAPIIFRRCFLEEVDAVFLLFHSQVVFEDCTFKLASFYAAYFFQGAEFINCLFMQDVTFECGGHNEPPFPFHIKSCRFMGFVNFFDNWFPGPVEIRDCHFEQGTNLLGNDGHPFEVMFEVPPIIEGNSGDLAKDGG